MPLAPLRPRQAYPQPKPVTTVNPKDIVRNSAARASKGWRVRDTNTPSNGLTLAPGTALDKIKRVALKTFGFKSVLWLRQQVELDRMMLELDRSTFMVTWWEIARWFAPRSPRFLESDVNKGWLRNEQIIDDTAGQCRDVLKAGMLSGMSSPTRQWFKISLKDRRLMDFQKIKDWCYDVSAQMASVFQHSNLYEELATWYEGAALFATSLVWMEQSPRNVVRFKALPIGSYAIHHDNEGFICKFHRKFLMTVTQLLDEFGVRDKDGEIMNWENFSQAVRSANDNYVKEYWFYVGHYIRPNNEYEPEAPGTKGFPFLEVYYETGQVNESAPGIDATSMGSEQWRFLRVRGLRQMPLMELIWQKTGEDDYGTECPGTRTLGNVRQLQAQEARVAQAAEKQLNPPLQGPMTAKGKVNWNPGKISLYDQRGPDGGLKPLFETRFDITQVEAHSEMLRQQIRSGWFFELFMAMQALNDEKEQPVSATEIREMKEEKLLMLSPVLEKANLHGFKPLIEFTYRVMLERAMFPPAPPEMKGKELSVEFTSIFSEALKALELESIQAFEGDLANYAQLAPNIMDNVDMDELVRLRADKGNVPSHIMRDEDDVKKMRQQRAKVQAQQLRMQQQQQQAQTAKTASQASLDPNQPSALTQAMGM